MGVDRFLIKKRNTKVEIREGTSCESFHEDIDDNIRVVEFWVELVPEEQINEVAFLKIRCVTASKLQGLQDSRTPRA